MTRLEGDGTASDNGVYRESTASQPTAGQSVFGLKVQARFGPGHNARLSFSSIDTGSKAQTIWFSWNTGLPLRQGDQHDGAGTNRAVHCHSTGTKAKRNARAT